MYLSLARADARPIAKALRRRPKLHLTCQWANFVRNHDELTLDKLSDRERQEVFDVFGPDSDMQVYGRGLRRRLTSMLGGDERQMKMVYSLAFSLPGTPVLFYGEEIGMAETSQSPAASPSGHRCNGLPTTMAASPPPPSGGSLAQSPTVSTGRSASTLPTSGTNPSGGSCATSSTPTGSSPRSVGRRSKSSSNPIPRSWPACARRSPDG
jgi:glycosidase